MKASTGNPVWSEPGYLRPLQCVQGAKAACEVLFCGRVIASMRPSHAALTERFEDLVMTEGFADQDVAFLPGGVRR